VGFTGSEWQRSADTAWARAGPTPLARGLAGAAYESRAMAYWHGDSTHFRWYVAVAPPPRGWAHPDDSLAVNRVGLCGEISRAAAVHGLAPGSPTGDESLAVWRRRP
jgi:hypothetical protein